MKKILGFLAVVVLIGLGWFGWDRYTDRNKTIQILKPTALFEAPGLSVGTTPKATLSPGENLEVLEIKYGKDSMNVEVRRSDGSTGWVVVDDGVAIK